MENLLPSHPSLFGGKMKKNYSVFVVEDETDIAELIRFNLSVKGYSVRCFSSGEDMVKACQSELPDIFLLDLMLPGINGVQICELLRKEQKTKTVPVVMVTARGEEQDILRGLEAGADDYITKPFSPRVLEAKVSAVLRRSSKDLFSADDGASDEKNNLNEGEILKIHNVEIHPGRYEVKIDGEKVELRNSEFRILQFLAKRPGWVFTRSQIVDAVHGKNYAVTDRSVDFQMVGLRKKMGTAGDFIETIRGVGYRFKEES